MAEIKNEIKNIPVSETLKIMYNIINSNPNNICNYTKTIIKCIKTEEIKEFWCLEFFINNDNDKKIIIIDDINNDLFADIVLDYIEQTGKENMDTIVLNPFKNWIYKNDEIIIGCSENNYTKFPDETLAKLIKNDDLKLVHLVIGNNLIICNLYIDFDDIRFE